MSRKHPKPEEIVSKLRQIEVLVGQGMKQIDAIREIGIVGQTFYRWRKPYGGIGTAPLSLPELQLRHDSLLIPEQALFALQTGIMVWGVWMAVRILGRRAHGLFGTGRRLKGWRLLPMINFIVAVSGFNMWLMMQGMLMRMG